MTDEQILGRIRAGDPAGFDTLVARWEGPLFAFTFRMLGREEDAREVCQETFLRVWSQAKRFREGSRFSTWMYQIALNLCRDLGRRKRRWARVVTPWSRGNREDEAPRPEEYADTAAGPEERATTEDLRERVRRALGELPPALREVLVLKQWEGLTFREIARLLDCPESTVKSRLYDGLSRMRSRLEDGHARL
jgi:RNA polymerase sigma-70 factor (ECF subfamily)